MQAWPSRALKRCLSGLDVEALETFLQSLKGLKGKAA